jgi:hypothetical protein
LSVLGDAGQLLVQKIERLVHDLYGFYLQWISIGNSLKWWLNEPELSAQDIEIIINFCLYVHRSYTVSQTVYSLLALGSFAWNAIVYDLVSIMILLVILI